MALLPDEPDTKTYSVETAIDLLDFAGVPRRQTEQWIATGELAGDDDGRIGHLSLLGIMQRTLRSQL